jgi:hypothetical protein
MWRSFILLKPMIEVSEAEKKKESAARKNSKIITGSDNTELILMIFNNAAVSFLAQVGFLTPMVFRIPVAAELIAFALAHAPQTASPSRDCPAAPDLGMPSLLKHASPTCLPALGFAARRAGKFRMMN